MNAKPHLGHTYTTVIADCLARYKKMQGFEVCFLAGTDEHGQNIERAAAAKGITPKELADTVAVDYQKLWSQYGIEYDQFIRTTENRHRLGAAEIFKRAAEKAPSTKVSTRAGIASIAICLLPKARRDRTAKSVCVPLREVTEASYFFRYPSFQKNLLDHYQKHPDFVMPPSRFNEVVSFVSGGLKDLSISRTSVKWGIPVPGDDQHVIYVWFDALVGYLTGIGFGDPAGMKSFRIFGLPGPVGRQRHSSVSRGLLARLLDGGGSRVTEADLCARMVAEG